ncbi:MAG: hypothetical protein ACYTXC_19595 [Nostoc sp.]
MSDFSITLQNLSSSISNPFLRWAVLRVGGGGRFRLGAIASLINYLLTIYWMQRIGSYVILDRRVNSVMSLILVLKGFFLLVFTDFSEKLKSLHSDDFGENRCQFM